MSHPMFNVFSLEKYYFAFNFFVLYFSVKLNDEILIEILMKYFNNETFTTKTAITSKTTSKIVKTAFSSNETFTTKTTSVSKTMTASFPGKFTAILIVDNYVTV